jgi:GntR family transcriptional repressor for pyruvate dehydrogenase complex
MNSLSKNTILNTPLKKKSVVMLVIDRIKLALINGELKPGDFIPSESELTQNLGVGKSSVREATKMLQAMGVLEVKRGQGTIIRKSHDEDALNLFHGPSMPPVRAFSE